MSKSWMYFLRISAVPSYAGLRRFSDGRNFEQWTGDDSKALMKVCSDGQTPAVEYTNWCQVYISAIAGHVPSEIVQCLATFMDLCYIFHRNSVTSSALKSAD